MLSFQDLYESYAPEVYRFALWLTGDRSEAEDITSETFVRAWVRIDKIRTETLKAYLFMIARNFHLEQHRKNKRQVVLNDVYPDPSPGPGRMVDAHLQIMDIQRILQILPEVDRAAFILRVQHELPYAEIARVLRLSVAATKVKVHRVRKKLLATCLEKEAK
jgi:RNA polymerase sigma-70 factor (ECF subfamily)